MEIAILSDSHDHIWNLEKVLKQIKGKAEAIIHCGDIIAPFTVELLASAHLSTYICFGNNVDQDQMAVIKKANDKFEWVPIAKENGEISLDNRKIAFCHYPKIAELLAKSGAYDAVFYGHTHLAENKKVEKTLLLNPGAICGIQNGKPGIASYAIYNTQTNSAEIVEIK